MKKDEKDTLHSLAGVVLLFFLRMELGSLGIWECCILCRRWFFVAHILKQPPLKNWVPGKDRL